MGTFVITYVKYLHTLIIEWFIEDYKDNAVKMYFNVEVKGIIYFMRQRSPRDLG